MSAVITAVTCVLRECNCECVVRFSPKCAFTTPVQLFLIAFYFLLFLLLLSRLRRLRTGTSAKSAVEPLPCSKKATGKAKVTRALLVRLIFTHPLAPPWDCHIHPET